MSQHPRITGGTRVAALPIHSTARVSGPGHDRPRHGTYRSGSLRVRLAPTNTRAPRPSPIKVLSQNIMYGGDDYDLETGEYCAVVDTCMEAFHRLRNIIVKSDADVVGLQEPERNVAKMARQLGWYASPGGTCDLAIPDHRAAERQRALRLRGRSAQPGGGGLQRAPQLRPVGSGHDRRRASRSRRCLAAERAFRVRDIRPNLKGLPPLVDQGIPVILTGDFNSPSHLDWTEEVTDRPARRREVPRQTGRSACGSRRRGSSTRYRQAHPDPVTDLAFTWTPVDRPGRSRTTSTTGSTGSCTPVRCRPSTARSSASRAPREDASVEIAVKAPYPSDHRGVVSTLNVTPHRPAGLRVDAATTYHRR